MNLSNRIQGMQESAIRKLVPLAEKAKQKGNKIYHLNIGQPDIITPKEVIDAVKKTQETIIRYSPSRGEDFYLEALKNYYSRIGIDVEHKNMIVTVGGSEAIIFSLMTICDPGDEIIIPEPFYTNYNGFATMAGVKVVPVLTVADDGFSLPMAEVIEEKITDKTKAILICNPNNPTGVVFTKEELETITKLAVKHNLFVLSDEVYREFVYDDTEHISVLSIPELKERAIMLDSISKRYSCCGSRIGCVVSFNTEIMDNMMKLAQARLCAPYFEQIGATAATMLSSDYFNETKKEYQKRRDIVFNGIQDIPGAMCRKPEGAFYVIARLPINDTEDFAKWLLEDFSNQKETVMVAPASGFYATPDMGNDEIRVAYVLNCEDLKRAMELLKIAVKHYQAI